MIKIASKHIPVRCKETENVQYVLGFIILFRDGYNIDIMISSMSTAIDVLFYSQMIITGDHTFIVGQSVAGEYSIARNNRQMTIKDDRIWNHQL